jgi:hypothetical protein
MNTDSLQIKQMIDFRKKRDFGELFNATFQFIRTEIKKLIIPALLSLPMAMLVGYSSALWDIEMEANSGDVLAIYNVYYFLMLLFSLFMTLVMQTAVISYIKVYLNNEGRVDLAEVFRVIGRKILPSIVYSIPVVLIVMIGFVFLILPGIYFAIVFQFIFVVVILEDNNKVGKINQCFKVIKNFWWLTFGSVIVLNIISFAVNFIFSIPEFFIVGVESFNDISYAESSVSTTTRIIISCVASISNLIGMIVPVFITFHYFNLVERKEETTLMSNIGTISENNDSSENIQD